MPIFVAVAHTRPDLLGAKVKEFYPDSYTLEPSAWFFFASGTATEIREKFGLDGGKLGAQAVIIQVGDWAGYAPSDLWTWMKSRLEAKPNG